MGGRLFQKVVDMFKNYLDRLENRRWVEKVKLSVKNGELLCNNRKIGMDKKTPGFSQYIFDEEPLGKGANGITYRVTHKVLGVRQVVKIYFPKDDETDNVHKAREESIKNANTALNGIIAVTFDAGVYSYPCRLWYSCMESVSSFATIKEWRKERDGYFKINGNSFDVFDMKCLRYMNTALKLAAGILQAVIGLYEHDVIHGDLNPGNILWILERENLNKTLDLYSSKITSSLGKLEPCTVKLIDMGASKVNNNEKEEGKVRDAYKIYEHIKSLMYPLFNNSNSSIEKWFKFDVIKSVTFKEKYGIEGICGVLDEDGTTLYYVEPKELAGDCFRLVCVITIAFGLIFNLYSEKRNCIQLSIDDIRDFYELMNEMNVNGPIRAFSFDSMITIQKIKSKGRLINWENVWDTYPLKLINIEPVFDEMKSIEAQLA